MLQKKISIFVFLGMFVWAGAEEIVESNWDKSLLGGVNLTQTGFDNWVSGGENAFAWQLNINYKFTQNLPKTTWSNTGKLAYGATKIGDADTRKSVDELKIESVLTYKLGSSINPFVAVTGKTQFAPGFNYGDDTETQISDFMDPGYFRESFGAGFDVREGMKTRLGLALKQTSTTDYPSPYADDATTTEIETFKSEVGAESVTDISITVSETSILTSKLEMFSNFKSLDETDINWDNTLMIKVSALINMNINVKLLYDKDLSTKRQIKQAMALGINYTFI